MNAQLKARPDTSRREMRRIAQIIPYIWEPVVCNCEHECEWEFGCVVEMPDLPSEITIRPKRPGTRYFAFKLGYHERKDGVYR